MTGPVYYTGAMATVNWTGTTNSTWSTSSTTRRNWSNSGADYQWVNQETQANFPTGPSRKAITIGGTTPKAIAHGLNFTGDGYTISGGSLTVTGGGIVTSENVTINSAVYVGAPQSWNVAAGKTLSITGALHTIISDLTFSGPGNTTISGKIDGGGVLNTVGGAKPGSLIQAGTGMLTLSGASTFDGDIRVNAGTLTFAPAASASATYSGTILGSAPIVINTAGTVSLTGDSSNFSGGLTVNAGTLDYSNSVLPGGNVTISGGTLNIGAVVKSIGTLQIASGTVFGHRHAQQQCRLRRAKRHRQRGARRHGRPEQNHRRHGHHQRSHLHRHDDRLGGHAGVQRRVAGRQLRDRRRHARHQRLVADDRHVPDQRRHGQRQRHPDQQQRLQRAKRHRQRGPGGQRFADQDRPGRVRPQQHGLYRQHQRSGRHVAVQRQPAGRQLRHLRRHARHRRTSSAIGTLQISGGAVSGSGTLTSSTSFNVQSGAVNVVLAGSASLSKTGPDVFVVNNPAYTGSTTVSGGTLTFSGNLPDGAYAVSGGTLDIGSISKSIGAFQITSGAVIGSGTLTSSGTYAVAGGQVDVALAGSGGLTKSNKAQAILNGANTYSGATTITSGVLRATIGTLDAPVGGINYNSFLRLDGGIYQSASASTFNRSLGASGSAFQWTANGGGFSASEGGLTVNIGDGAALTWGNNVGSEIVGPLRLSSLWAASPTTFQNAIDLNGGERIVSVDDSPSSTLDCGVISGVLSGTGSLTKAGYGLLVLTANNTYSGVTTVSLGTLQLGAGSASGDVGSSSGIVINSGCILSVNRSNVLAYANPISGDGVLTMLGAGTLTLSAANSFSGSVTVNNGTLSVDNLAANGNPSGIGTGYVGLQRELHLGLNGGTMLYTGGANDVFNRTITVGTNDGTINQSGSGYLFSLGVISGTGVLTKTGSAPLDPPGQQHLQRPDQRQRRHSSGPQRQRLGHDGRQDRRGQRSGPERRRRTDRHDQRASGSQWRRRRQRRPASR